MRRFFLALGVGVQVAARPLPHVIQPVQRAAERVVGEPPPGGDLQELLQQGDRPAPMRSAQVLGREGEKGLQQVLVIFVQRRVAPPSLLVPQRLGVVGLGVRLDPVVDTLPGHPEHAGEVRGGAPPVELQDGQRAPKDAGIGGSRELTPKAAPLPSSKVEPAHALLPDR
jgi:hypothetical protein